MEATSFIKSPGLSAARRMQQTVEVGHAWGVARSATPRGRPGGATAEGPSGGGAQAQVYKSTDPIVH